MVTTVNFDDEYNNILERVETTTKKRPAKMKTFEETSRGQDIIKGKDDKSKKDKKKKKKKGDDSDPNGDGEDEGDEKVGDSKEGPQEPGESEIERNRRLFFGMKPPYLHSNYLANYPIAKKMGSGRKKEEKPKEETPKK